MATFNGITIQGPGADNALIFGPDQFYTPVSGSIPTVIVDEQPQQGSDAQGIGNTLRGVGNIVKVGKKFFAKPAGSGEFSAGPGGGPFAAEGAYTGIGGGSTPISGVSVTGGPAGAGLGGGTTSISGASVTGGAAGAGLGGGATSAGISGASVTGGSAGAGLGGAGAGSAAGGSAAGAAAAGPYAAAAVAAAIVLSKMFGGGRSPAEILDDEIKGIKKNQEKGLFKPFDFKGIENLRIEQLTQGGQFVSGESSGFLEALAKDKGINTVRDSDTGILKIGGDRKNRLPQEQFSQLLEEAAFQRSFMKNKLVNLTGKDAKFVEKVVNKGVLSESDFAQLGLRALVKGKPGAFPQSNQKFSDPRLKERERQKTNLPVTTSDLHKVLELVDKGLVRKEVLTGQSVPDQMEKRKLNELDLDIKDNDELDVGRNLSVPVGIPSGLISPELDIAERDKDFAQRLNELGNVANINDNLDVGLNLRRGR